MTGKGNKATATPGKARAPRGGGSLSERPGHRRTWRLRWRESGRTRETTFAGARSAATRELRRLTALAGNAPPAREDEKRTVGELLDSWRDRLEGDKAPRYVAENRRIVETRLRPELGKVRLDQLTVTQLDDLFRKWAKEGLTGATIRCYAAPLRTALGQAGAWGGSSGTRQSGPRSRGPRRAERP